MNFEAIGAIVFVLVVSLILYLNRKKIKIQKIFFPFLYVILLKTKIGLKFMNRISKKHPKTIRILSNIAIITGFLGMAFISYTLIVNFINLVTTPQAASSMGMVLPIPVDGVFYVPFFYWIISIFILATVHEFSHGIVARLNKIKVKSSGFGFFSILLPAIPLAFVEPDQKKLSKAKTKKQLAVFAAGPFANIALGLIILLISIFVISPLASSYVFQYDGVTIEGIAEIENGSMPAELAGMEKDEVIKSIEGTKTTYMSNFTRILENHKPGDTLDVITNKSRYNVTLTNKPGTENVSYFGVIAGQSKSIKEPLKSYAGGVFAGPIVWLIGLAYWLYLLNIGIGMFNLVPLGPVDGGLMLKAILLKICKKKKNAMFFFKWISTIFLFLIAVILIYGFF